MWRLLEIRARVYSLPGGLVRVEGSTRVCGSEITSFPELWPMTAILKPTVGWKVGVPIGAFFGLLAADDNKLW